ncbi:MAG TPA: B12-binding domain-containing radical SAM protein, partial [candidate division Zixibacteria bacterium]|nr:B12-binding domain-containing radical SAM protein [candidate division Zixibacteria bacterium]
MLKNELEKRFFPYVIKPGRYAGGEPGTVIKDHSGKTLYCHAFPDKYEIGQSYLGLQSIYHIVNSDDRFVCERTFAVDIDAEEILRKENLPLFSLETCKDVKEFDAVGFTLSYEMVFTTLLNMLDLSGIPIRSKDRDDNHPIIMAGGPAAYNPEPMADFVDIFFIG